MDIKKLNSELARAVAALSGHVTGQSVSANGEIPDIVNDAELMEALKRAYDGFYIQSGTLRDPRAYWAEAGFPPNRSGAWGATAHGALGRAIAQYLQEAATIGMLERRRGRDRRAKTDRRGRDHQGLTYPFMDGHGVLAMADRRVMSDRRFKNIPAHWGADRRSD